MLGLFFLFSLFISPEELFKNTVFYNFQGRDLSRAKDILAGNWMFYGPEMTGGGNLPGPLYYVVLAIGLVFERNWISAWAIQYLFTFAAAAAGFYFFRKKSLWAAVVWVILFATAPLTAWFEKLFLNVSYLLPFAVGALVFVIHSFHSESEKNRRHSYYAASILVGAGLQFHFSIIFLWFALLFMIFFSKKLSLPAFTKSVTATGALLFLLPSMPHLIWLVSSKAGFHFGKPAFYSGEAEKALPSIIFLIKASLGAPWEKLIASWTNKICFTTPFALVPFLFLKKSQTVDKRLKVLLICLAFSFIPYFNWYLSPQANRYTILFFIGLNFLTAFKVKELLETEQDIRLFKWAAGATLVAAWIYAFLSFPDAENRKSLLINLALLASCIVLFSLVLKKRTLALALSLVIALSHMQKLAFPETVFYTKSVEGYMPSYKDWKHIFKRIQEESGWDFQKIRQRTYFIGHHVNQDPGLFIEAFDHSSANGKIDPDGFIISNRYKAKQMKLSPRNWMLRQNLHKNVLEALRQNELELGHNISDSILIIPYYVKNQKNIPRHIHNIGEGYQISEADLQLEQIQSSEGSLRIDSSTVMFKWNECPDTHKFCSTGAVIKVDANQLQVKVIGAAISQITPWISPNFTQAWIEPYVEIKCDNNTYKYELATSIGFLRNYSHSPKTFFFAGNNSFVAPFERSFKHNCIGKPQTISLGRTKSQIEMVVKVRELPGKLLSINL